MYNIFTDFHHASLLNSLILFFEKRLGGNVYRPIGMEWATEGFWKVYDHPATQAQFLGMEQGHRPIDGTQALNQIKDVQEGVYYCKDIDSEYHNKAITFGKFMGMRIDIVIASIPQHIEPFRKLCELHPNKPKLIYQIGNSWTLELSQRRMLDGVMSSAKLPIIFDVTGHNGKQLPMVEYHQEFDTGIFNPFDNDFGTGFYRGCNANTVTSFVNCFNIDGLFAHDWQIFQDVEKLMPEWKFKCMGGQCRDGAAHGARNLAATMLDSQFIWHTKNGGDGYGHVLHNSAAVGRPLIIKKQYYLGKMGESLIKDGETAIVIDGLSPSEIVQKIEYYSETQRWQTMCKKVYSNFKDVVDFDKEQLCIKQFLANLL